MKINFYKWINQNFLAPTFNDIDLYQKEYQINAYL